MRRPVGSKADERERNGTEESAKGGIERRDYVREESGKA